VKAIIYARFSPRPNAAESESIETQLDYCRAHCQAQGLEIAGEFEDRALSGDDEDRPGLWAAVDALRRGYILLVYRLDRLARSVYLSEFIRREVKEVFVRQVLQAEHEYAKKVAAARTKYAMLRHQAAGRRMGSGCPYGWKRDPKNPPMMVRDEEEQAVIRRIVELRKEGKTLRGIKDILDSEGVLLRGRKGWNHMLVANIVKRAGMP
jgi:site-specific DNA recombinase